MNWAYWLFNGEDITHRSWILTRLHRDNYVNFEAFHYRINNVLYKKHTAAFQEAVDKELIWEQLSH